MVLFLSAVIRSKRSNDGGRFYVINRIARSFLPYHRALVRRPVFLSIRYIFHLVLFAVPLWYSGHIILWEESHFSWSWTPLPDTWADTLTILFIFLSFVFLLRRLLFANLRKMLTLTDLSIIFLTALPFLTGYLSSHSDILPGSFIPSNILLLHIFSGEVFLLMIPFLFLRVVFDDSKCTGCTACTTVCPTQTLSFSDRGESRLFSYYHFQCISCGTCVRYCPDSAPSLRHELSAGRLFQPQLRTEIHTAKLSACDICGSRFAPEKQIERANDMVANNGFISLCPRCRATQAYFHGPILWTLLRKGPEHSLTKPPKRNQRELNK